MRVPAFEVGNGELVASGEAKGEEAAKVHLELEWQMTELVASHEGILDVLFSRFTEGLTSEPVSWEGEIPNWEAPK